MAMEARKYSTTRLFDINGSPLARQAVEYEREAVYESPAPQRKYREEPKVQRKEQPESRPEVTHVPLTTEQKKHRALLTISVFLVGAALFAAIWGFTSVSQAYAGVTALNNEITETEKRIADLNLKIEQNVNVNDILSGAEENGFILPDSSNVQGKQP